MGQQEAPSLGVVANSRRHAGHEGNRRGFECILKKYRKIESVSPPLLTLLPGRCQSQALVNEDLISAVGVPENVCGGLARDQTDFRMRQKTPQCPQRGQTHHGIADPVWDPDDDVLDFGLFYVHREI